MPTIIAAPRSNNGAKNNYNNRQQERRVCLPLATPSRADLAACSCGGGLKRPFSPLPTPSKQARPWRLKEKVRGRGRHVAGQRDLEIRGSVAVGIRLEPGVGTVKAEAQLSGHAAEGRRADEDKGLVARDAGIGVDRGEVDSVGAAEEVRDSVGGGAVAAVSRVEAEGVDSPPAGQDPGGRAARA